MKIFGGDMVTSVYNSLGVDENMPLQMGLLSKTVESAQRKVEGKHFSIRKHVLQYDDVMNTQREIIYGERRQVLDGENLKDKILKMFSTVAEQIVLSHVGEELNVEGLKADIKAQFGITNLESLEAKHINEAKVIEEVNEKILDKYSKKEEEFGEADLREVERVVMLKVVDQKWMDHIDSMDELKNGIGLRAYGQKDPVVQYRMEGFDMFEQMIEDIKVDVVKMLMNLRKQEEARREQAVKITGAALQSLNSLDQGQKVQNTANADVNRTVVNEGPKVGRNDPCTCGSGKKYKNCCGRN